MPVPISNVTFAVALAIFRRFGFWVVSEGSGRRRRGRGSHVNMTNGLVVISLPDRGRIPIKGPLLGREVARSGIDLTAFLWALGRHNRHGHPAPRGWRVGMPVPEGEQDRG